MPFGKSVKLQIYISAILIFDIFTSTSFLKITAPDEKAISSQPTYLQIPAISCTIFTKLTFLRQNAFFEKENMYCLVSTARSSCER